MNRILLLLLISFQTSGVFGQTFLGKRHYVSIGTAISPTIGLLNAHTEDVEYQTDYTILPARIELEYGIALNQTASFSLSGFYRGLPNSQYTIEKEYSEDLVNYSRSDQYQLATNMMNISLNLKLHTEYSPFGPYVKISLGYNRAWSDVYPTLNQTTEVYYGMYNPLVFEEYTKLAPWKERSQFVNIGFGIGKSVLLTKNFYLDYGIQLGLFSNFQKPSASKYNPRSTSPGVLKEATRMLSQKTATATALSSNLFQFYVKFGFSK